MKILALDTAQQGCSVGLWDQDSNTQQIKLVETQREQAQILVPLIQDQLQLVGWSFSDLELIAVCVGPGSFTGLRIGLSTARSLSLARDVPLVGLTNLEVCAAQAVRDGSLSQDQSILCILETKRKDFYVQVFDQDIMPVTQPDCVEEEGLRTLVEDYSGCLIAGNNGVRVQEIYQEDLSSRMHTIKLLDPLVIAQRGLELRSSQPAGGESKVVPLYLQGAHVSKPKNKLRKLKS